MTNIPDQEKCPEGLGNQQEQGIRCDFFGEEGGCTNGLMGDDVPLLAVHEQRRCDHARINNVFGTLMNGKFEQDSQDPTGMGRLSRALLERFSPASASDFPVPEQPAAIE